MLTGSQKSLVAAMKIVLRIDGAEARPKDKAES